jgi:hypothetical protein
MKTFDSGNINVSVVESAEQPSLPGYWTAETYLRPGLWRWVRVNGESKAMLAIRNG